MSEIEPQQPESDPGPTPLTIPVHVDVRAEQVVLAQPEMERLLRNAGQIAVGDCECRKTKAACDRPLETCLGLDDDARSNIEANGWREIGVAEALELLERTHRAGLVHLAFRRKDGSVDLICSCCRCCCGFLGSLAGRSYRDALTFSAYVARHDPKVCSGCGICVERCPFGAFVRSAGADGVVFDSERCFGCGLCVSTCPSRAVSFVERASA